MFGMYMVYRGQINGKQDGLKLIGIGLHMVAGSRAGHGDVVGFL